MSKIHCSYYDKTLQPANDMGDLTVTRRDFAHALLSLYGTCDLKNVRRLELRSFFLKINARFRFPLFKNLVYRVPHGNIYDGILRTDSELFAAAIAVMVALKKYKHRHVFGLPESRVISNNGSRPDFLATNGNDYSLFESKGSLNCKGKVDDDRVTRGIAQLNSVSGILLENGTVVNKFKEKVVVATGLINCLNNSGDVECNIYDPDNTEGETVAFDVFKALDSYYSFIRDIIDASDEGEKQETKVGECGLIVTRVLNFDGMTMEIGLLDKLYRRSFKTFNDIYGILNDIGRSNHCLYSDGVYLKIDYNRDFFPHNRSHRFDH